MSSIPINAVKFISFLFLAGLFNFYNLSAKDTAITFDDQQSILNWFDAEAFCRNQGKRLPEYKEMESAKKSGITSQWKEKNDKDSIARPEYWVSNDVVKEASFFPIYFEYTDLQMMADKKSKKLVRCVKDSEMERRIASSKSIENWSSYQGYMTKQAAQDRCNQLGMRLPTEKEFREAYFARITDEWIGEYQSENLSYGGTSTQGFNLFTPDIGSYAFSQWNGNAHIRCIRK
ncbi:hypothetical protein B1J93_11500 [Leptospira kirschneri serovar Pomona]|uniref:Sulfatase-modifying factor enzyme-like domain-containing protein n=1 Tax=Leptospira kirschneri serovar Pomona TaxID=561005 RepID=A0A1T1DM39_9LEPT|nr:SUMF1/EgtB/PvdO family nonheme iron enzyme [Leptospira kirschneri]EMK06679.1 hypothetical protein LEP1GSC166_1317 [Leptospira kirschneri]OOV41955.1 hypothetical protein B1J93_11500 [Leptospira kirschneri serovar Pomona]